LLVSEEKFLNAGDAVILQSVSERAAHSRRPQESNAFNLMAREGGVRDLAGCQSIHESCRLPYPEACARVLPEIWRTLISGAAMHLFLVENRARPFGSRLVSFSATVFVTDLFCLEALTTLPPNLGAEVARRYLSRESPVLNREQVARANAGEGLNVMSCFEGWQHDALSRDQILAVREKQSEAFHIAHGGYRVKEFIAEPIGEDALRWMVESGAHLRRDYAADFRKLRVPMPRSSQRPWLVGLKKEEAFARPGSYLSSFFVHTPPRFHFNRSEQTLLRQALMGKTCEELAASLFISAWTVKKRWRAIYDRVADVDPELVLPVANGPDATLRGAERRRHLLHYLRQHLEELRPSSP
jgi:hypothetical protein